MKRILFSRDDIVSVDTYTVFSTYPKTSYNWVGEGSYHEKMLFVYSKKGNPIREIIATQVEVDGVSPLCWMLHTTSKIRNREVVLDRESRVLTLHPVGRLKANNNLIYSIV